MTRARSIWSDRGGASAAEFALVLPLMLIFLLGIMDVGFYAWQINRAEKATQTGARWAVATDLIPSGLVTYSFATDGGITQGTTVPEADSFEEIVCSDTGCACSGACPFPDTVNTVAFDDVVGRMQEIKNEIEPGNVEIVYSWSGLGFSGDPNGPDVSPFVTVRLVDMQYQPLFTLITGGDIDLPEFAYTLTAEDSDGAFAN
jgi:hypothetical protein